MIIFEADFSGTLRTVGYEEDYELDAPYNIVVALDVLEHTGNHLGFLKWIEGLGEKAFISFPYITKFYPPYEPVIDEWVDVDAISSIIVERYENVDFHRIDGRIFIQYETGC